MTDVPDLIDRRALALRRARALGAGEGPGFLRRRVAEELDDRLAGTLRTFPRALDLATPGDETADALARRPGVERVVRAAAAPGPKATLICDPEILPFAPERFDLVVSALALQFANDLPGVFAQVRRMLRPDGLFLAAIPGGETLTELRQAFTIAEGEIEGGLSPRVLPFADVRVLGGLLQRAGFALPVTDVDRVTVRYTDPLALMADLRAWGATNVLVQRRKAPLRRATLTRAIEVYAEQFSDLDGRVRATFEIVWLSGWAPHPGQQKPLKPGSATTRLADALRASAEQP